MKIDKGIPIPKSRRPGGVADALRQLATAAIGDSVLFKDSAGRCVPTTAARLQRELGVKFTCRVDKATGDVRVWRTA